MIKDQETANRLADEKIGASKSLKVLSMALFAFSVFAFVGSAALWGQGFVLSPPAGVNVALPLADMLVNAPASMVAAVGLWRRRRYGYLAGYFVAGLYVYASAFIIIEALEERSPEFWAILLPQLLAVVVALALLLSLPRRRGQFR